MFTAAKAVYGFLPAKQNSEKEFASAFIARHMTVGNSGNRMSNTVYVFI